MNAPRISTKLLTWNKANRVFTCEASDLRGLYQPSESFELVSHRTGTRVLVSLSKTHRSEDEDAEITHWTFRPADDSFRVEVFND